jgi:predicted nucleic-acid-binding protein
VIGIDTDILLRYVDKEDISQIIQTGERLFVSDIVLIDAVWELRSNRRLPKPQVVDALDSILTSETFVFEDLAVVNAAFADYRNGKGDFADYLIGRRNAAAGCEHTVTFDKALAKHPAFVIL